MTSMVNSDQSTALRAALTADAKAFADALPAVVILVDGEARIVVANQRLSALCGIGSDMLAGTTFDALLHPEEFSSFQLSWRQAVTAGEPFELEHRLRDRQGNWCWFLCRAAPYRAQGVDDAWLVVCTEIEDRKIAEQHLARSEAWYRSTFDHGAVGIAHLSCDGILLDVNQRLCAMLLRDRSSMLGTYFEEFCHPADAGLTRPGIEALRDGRQQHFVSTKRYLKADGSAIWGYLTVSAERDDKGALTHFVAFIEDVTMHKARQDRIEQTLAASGTVGWEWHPATDQVIHTGDEHAIFGRPFAGGQEFFDSIVAEDREAVRAAATAMLASGEPYEMEFRVMRPDGQVRWVRDRGYRIVSHGELTAVGLLQDITAERLARNALQEREERLRLAFEASRTSAWDWSIETGEVVWSESLAGYLDLQPQEFGGTFEAFWALVHPDDRAHLETELQAALAGVRDYAVEFRMVRPDGSIRWTSTHATVVRDHDGRAVRMVGVDSDITDRKNAECAAMASEAQLRSLIDTMPQKVWMTQPDGRTDYYNSRYYAFTGVSPGSTEGEEWVEAFHPDDRQRSAERWRHSVATGEPYEIEYRLRHHGGGYRWVLGRALPLRDAEGAIVRWLGTCTDIHEMVEARDALTASRAELEEARRTLAQSVEQRTADLIAANQRLREEIARREITQAALIQSQKLEALGQLVSGVSHDFNNVIQAVAGGYDVIARRSTDPMITSLAGHGVRAAERGGRLVRQLLAMARQQTLDLQVMDAAQMLAEAEPLLARSLGDTIKLRIDCPPGLPPVRIDQAMLETALINLAVNARDAMNEGGDLIVAVMECPIGDPDRPPELEGRPALEISVADTGSGMAPEVLQRVVEPFFTTKAPDRGTGLGLAMVAAFMRQSGGAFRIESRLGEGTTVRLYLQVSAEALAITASQAEPVASGKSRLTVLLVDDDSEVRPVVAAQLAELGHAIIEAASGRQALILLADHDVDLVLTDAVMPDMDGVVLTSTIHSVAPALPVVMMTGHADQESPDGLILLRKPFSSDRLHDAIAQSLKAMGTGRRPLGAELASLAGRIRSPAARELLHRWGQLAAERVPLLLNTLAWQRWQEQVTVVRVDQSRVPMTFHLIEAGAALDQAFGQPLAGSDVPVVGDDHPSAREQAFRRCARSGRPTYDYVRCKLGDGRIQLFERLLLPFASDGSTVDSILGVVELQTLPDGVFPDTEADAGNAMGLFDAPDLARRVEALPQDEIHRLPFGAIKLDVSGHVLFYSEAERRLSGSGDRLRLGRHFFVEIAPCMDTPSYRGRIERARETGQLDLEFTHIGDFADGHRVLTVKVQSARNGDYWIFMKREA